MEANDAYILLIVLMGWMASLNNSPYANELIGLSVVALAYLVPLGVVAAQPFSRVSLAYFQVILIFLSIMIALVLATSTLVGGVHAGPRAFYALGTFLLSLVLFLSSTMLPNADKSRRYLGLPALGIFIIFLAAWAIAGFPIRWEFIFGNVNAFGMFAAIAAAGAIYLLDSKLTKLVIFMAGSIFLIALTAKGALLFFVTFSLVYSFWRLIVSHWVIYSLCALFTISLVVAFPYIYVRLATTEVGSEVDFLVRALFFDSDFFSGRQEIWPALLQNGKRYWLAGQGAMPVEVSLRGQTLSAHNVYLSLFVQGGVLLLVSYVSLLSVIAVRLYRLRNFVRARFAGGVLFAYSVHQMFDVALFHNNLSASFWFWLVVGIGIASPTHRPNVQSI